MVPSAPDRAKAIPVSEEVRMRLDAWHRLADGAA